MTTGNENQNQAGVPPLQGGQQAATPAPQAATPAPQAQQRGNNWAIPAAILIGMLLLALAIGWGLSQARASNSNDALLIALLQQQQTHQCVPQQQGIAPVTPTVADVGGYHYRNPSTTAAGDRHSAGYRVIGPAIIKLDSYSLNPATTRMGLLMLNGEEYVLPESAVLWELTGSDEAIIKGESPYWDGFFRPFRPEDVK